MARPPTWLEVAVKNVGFIKAGTALSWAYCWAVTREQLHHEPTAEEVADKWAMSRASAYREQAIFRQAFPGLDTPSPIYASDQALETARKHAQVADRFDEWVTNRKERRANREAGAIDTGLLQAPKGTQ